MGQLFIHCKLGLCTKEPDKIQGNLRMVPFSSTRTNQSCCANAPFLS